MSDEEAQAAPSWDMDPVYEGGVQADPFVQAYADAQQAVADLLKQVRDLPSFDEDAGAYSAALRQIERVSQIVGALIGFANCTHAAKTSDVAARDAAQRARHLGSRLADASVAVDAALDAASDEVFEAFVTRPELADFEPALRSDRRSRSLRLARSERALSTSLFPHAVAGWTQLYQRTAGALKVHVALPGDDAPRPRSPSELRGAASHRDPAVRERVFHAVAEAWRGERDTCAMALDHITGARDALNRHRGVDELADTCAYNRVRPETLDALWSAVPELDELLRAYLERKAELLGKPVLDWWDLSAPLPQDDSEDEWLDGTFTSGIQLVEDSFRTFDPEMARFARHAVAEGWVDAAPRPSKRAGGFCARMPSVSQSRILMTWSPTLNTHFTLAHELGHAWHNHTLFEGPSPRRRVRSATAETASTFAEALLRDHLLTQAPEALRLRILENEIRSGVSYLLGVRVSYQFERGLYGMVREGPLAPDALDEAMARTQQQVFGSSMRTHGPHRWQSILHFYMATRSFYNWPYTFGYLFSTAVHAMAREQGASFVPRYRELLAQTGYAWAEDAAEHCLGVDLSQPAFWRAAMQPLEGHIRTFLDATAQAHP
ncbi:MAG: hypothetical protein KTR31_11770 [Myxococcales bacterium]|nr:hypothetical protein [Myxococcales bacterium]